MAFPLFIFLVRDHQLRYTHTPHESNQTKSNIRGQGSNSKIQFYSMFFL